MSKNMKKERYNASPSGSSKVVPIILLSAALLIAVFLITKGSGAFGEGIKALFLGSLSWGAYVVPLTLISHALFYKYDAESKKIRARIGFSVTAILATSVIEYAVRTVGTEAVFAPVQFFSDRIGGGFFGSIIGFCLVKLFGSIGVIIICAAVLAVYATFFFADKTGAYGKAAMAFADKLASLLTRVDDKIKDNNEKNRILKEEQDQLRREYASEELCDDEFFKPHGISGDVKVKSLGIDEESWPTGVSPLMKAPVVEENDESEAPVESIPVKKRSDRPLDLSYGMETSGDTYTIPSTTSDIGYTESAGLDDSPESVFTKDFDPFNFATGERVAARPSSKARAIEEELDDLAVYEMRVNHEPTERERRMMELERRKKEWLAKKNEGKVEADVAEAVPVSTQATVINSPIVEPVRVEPQATAEPIAPQPTIPVTAESAPVVSTPSSQTFETGVPEKVNAYTSYTTTKTTYTAGIDSLGFDDRTDSGAKASESTEDVAILIGQRIARDNPTYARSANEMRTFTRVTAAPGEDIFTAASTVDSPSQIRQDSEPQIMTFGDESACSGETVIEFGSEPAFEETAPEFTIEVGSSMTADGGDAELAAILAGFNGENRSAEPEIKPYTPPTVDSVQTLPSREESTLRVERSMLSPSAEIIEAFEEVVEFDSTEPEPEVEADEPTAQDIPEFIPEETDEPEIEITTSADSEEIEWSSEEEQAEEISDTLNDPEEIAEDEEEDADIIIPEGEDEVESTDEIPPEEQNPDVIKLREMFPFLEPLNQQKPEEKAGSIEETAEEEIEDVPFDEPVKVEAPKSSGVSSALTGLVAVREPKAEPKKKKANYSNYKFPSIELLSKEESAYDENIQSEIQENADKLIETLSSFGVTASIKGVDRGPRITRYEVVPAKGVKVSSILNLQDDIALNLAAGSIRMEAPIPGKSAVGIEIPNKKSSIVRLRNLLETEDFQASKSKTIVCIGRDVAGQPVFGDISKMPHLLIAGATGMGKSVCINSLLISVLYKARPDEVKLIMIDPKQVEFTMYNGIPHLLVPVVSDAKQAAGSLMWAVEEMERRYNLLNPLCVRNIDAYNEKVTADPSLGEPMPRIIIVIDEFADLMLQVKDPVETLVMRIAQKARAAGIYLVIGTQRPSVNVITGVIKANVPSRISCKVMSNVDSKTVLDSAGAEKLLDRGDALYAPAGSPKPHRVQCAFVSDGEVEAIMAHLKQFSDGSSYDSTVMEEIERAAQKCSKKGGSGSNERDDDDDRGSGEGYLNDPQFLDAVEVAVNTRKISTSLIQRKLSIGYGKAAKFIDIMEDMGIVGEPNGSRPREVLLTPDEWREKLARASYD